MLSSIFPDYDWLPWKFRKQTNWDSLELQKKFVEYVYKEKKMTSLDNWYDVSIKVRILAGKK